MQLFILTNNLRVKNMSVRVFFEKITDFFCSPAEKKGLRKRSKIMTIFAEDTDTINNNNSETNPNPNPNPNPYPNFNNKK